MAELLVAEGWVKSGSAGSYLRENLPDDFIVVADPRVSGQSLAAAVVGKGALFLVEDLNAEPVDETGAVAPVAPNGKGVVHAAESFLKDEFPTLQLYLMAVRSARDWAEGPVTWRVSEPAEWADQPLADAIVAADKEVVATISEDAQATLALGLRDRQLTASQPAARAFVFPSGGPFRSGRRVQNVRAAVAHMDGNAVDGIRVLRDGTLAAWLEEEGAHHLSALARDATRQSKIDARVMLETFLLGTGLVDRPRLVAKPAKLDLGYAAQGQKVSRRLRLEKVKGGRGYVFGHVTGGASWLRVEPREFAGTPAEFVVTAETASLPISPTPYLAEVEISSSASDEPVSLPLTLSVVAEPPGFIRLSVRPLVGVLAGALLGGLVALLWRATGVVGDHNMLLWTLVLAVVWGAAGGLRGLRQPASWPTRYALPRWLLKALGWSIGLGVLGAVSVEAWRLGLGGGLEFDGLSLPGAAAAGAAFGFVAATLGELARSRHAADQQYVHGRRSSRRPAILAAGGVLLLLVVLLTPRVIATVVDRTEVQAISTPARSWVEARWDELGESMDKLTRDLTMRYYDRPAGVVGPTPTPSVSGSELLKTLSGQ